MGPEKPSAIEWRLVARCLLEKGLLIGSPDEIWTHDFAPRTLQTLRLCVSTISTLVGERHEIRASFIKACVLQDDDIEEPPFSLDEVAEFLVEDSEARWHWQSMCVDPHFPHLCPRCGAAAFISFRSVDCKGKCH